MTTDKHDLTGKIPMPATIYDVVVVGAGESGLEVALQAAAEGKSVLLVDEHPVPGALMGTDVPYFFGGRATAAVQNSARMIEQIFATNPKLEAAFEAGIEVELGTAAWGLYRNGAALKTIPHPMIGLANAERAWMVGFKELVLATGARDIVLGFNGWTQPGVMGAQGFQALVTRYQAFSGQRVLILGAGAVAHSTLKMASDAGLTVVGLVAPDDGAVGRTGPRAVAAPADVPVYPAHVIAAITAGLDGVSGATLKSLNDGSEIHVDCDTIVLAIGTTPATELLEAAGITSDDTIRLVGDCAGAAPDWAEIQRWSDALGAYAPSEMIVCQCEEVTRADLLGVQPPNYIARPPKMQARALSSLLNDGPAHPDQIKRLTRAGMGTCQGRRCRDQVRCLLAQAEGTSVAAVPMASYRAPVRPIPLHILADWQEEEAMVAGWDVWFGIPTQWTPYAIVGTPEEAEHVSIVGGYSHV